ncbi:MAG: dienelactone hydrolase family protein [Pirellulales bacterium]
MWNNWWIRLNFSLGCCFLLAIGPLPAAEQVPFAAGPLTLTEPIDVVLRDGVDRFLDSELQKARTDRHTRWVHDNQSDAQFEAAREARLARLRHMLGLRDERVHPVRMELVETTDTPALVAHNARIQVREVRWPVLEHVWGEGLLLEPLGKSPVGFVIAIPDADQTPEQLIGLSSGVAAASQYPRWLAESGCRVLVVQPVNRTRAQFEWHGRKVDVTNREFLYRSAFELGRHLIGYELQKVLAAVDWQSQQKEIPLPIAVAGWGEGGLLSLYAAALDRRIQVSLVSGYFGPREAIWQQPIDRNVFGLLNDFGDAELAAMAARNHVIIEAAAGPHLDLSGGQGAPAKLTDVALSDVQAEARRVEDYLRPRQAEGAFQLVVSGDGTGPYGARPTLERFLSALGAQSGLVEALNPLERVRSTGSADERQARTMRQIDRQTQDQLRESQFIRDAYLSHVDTSSLEKYQQTIEPYRRAFADDVIGRFNQQLLPANPRARVWKSSDRWTGYEVVLDVMPDVIAYGILLVPKDLKPGERRPVVVCQHGLEGTCQDTIEPLTHPAYKGFAAQLANQGFVTFAPQNQYRGEDKFRVLQRKANPLGKTLFSVIVPQHQQIVDWLQTLDFVDPDRVAFYGLSYGGKTAMRVPSLVTDYCLSICSADFNEWVDKNASTRNPHSYVWSAEYEIFEFDLGSTFNYAEMAALIAPRPFMVERGHFDGVASDQTVGWEFGKVRHLYAAKLGIGDRCEIEWFVGPHTINGQGTFEFLHKHLQWQPKP